MTVSLSHHSSLIHKYGEDLNPHHTYPSNQITKPILDLCHLFITCSMIFFFQLPRKVDNCPTYRT